MELSLYIKKPLAHPLAWIPKVLLPPGSLPAGSWLSCGGFAEVTGRWLGFTTSARSASGKRLRTGKKWQATSWPLAWGPRFNRVTPRPSFSDSFTDTATLQPSFSSAPLLNPVSTGFSQPSHDLPPSIWPQRRDGRGQSRRRRDSNTPFATKSTPFSLSVVPPFVLTTSDNPSAKAPFETVWTQRC